MSKTFRTGVLGCGDYLRWQSGSIGKSERIEIAALFDPQPQRAAAWAEKLGGRAVDAADAILDDPSIDLVLLFVPPWIRKDLMRRAADAGKHIIATKPLAPNAADADEILQAVHGRVGCAVFYRRTDMAEIEALKAVFDGGQIGRLGLFKEDWLHHHPTWNDWATDPAKNGGPFMDSMIHNLNIARYLAAGEVEALTFFSDTYAQRQLRCADTEAMKVEFVGGGGAHLFVTWAGDLDVHSDAGNEREHIDHTHIISSDGWYISFERDQGRRLIHARKNKQVRTFPIEPAARTPYDRCVAAMEAGEPTPWDLIDAWKDIKLLDEAARRVGRRIEVDLTPPVNPALPGRGA